MGYISESLSIAEEIDNKFGIARETSNLGTIYYFMGEFERDLACQEKALALFQELGSKGNIAYTYGRISRYYEEKGDYDRALEYVRKMKCICEEIEWRSLLANAINGLSDILRERGDLDQSMAYSKQALHLEEEMGYCLSIAHTLGDIGLTHFLLNEKDRAKEYLTRAVNLERDYDMKQMMLYFIPNLMEILLDEFHFEEARKLCVEFQQIAKELKSQKDIFQGCILLTKIDFYAAEDKAKRMDFMEAMNTLLSKTDQDESRADIHYELASMHRVLNQPDQAELHRQEAIRLYKELYTKTPKYMYKKRWEELKTG